jgi:hypothetical protein
VAPVRSMLSEQSRRRVDEAEPTPCACDDRGTCGLHYSLADDYTQARLRERAGIKGFGRGTVAGHGDGRRG